MQISTVFSIYLYKRETCDPITIFVHFLFSIIYASSVVTDYSYKYLTTMLMPHSCNHAGPSGLFRFTYISARHVTLSLLLYILLFSIIYVSSAVTNYSYKYLTTMLVPRSCYHAGPNGLFNLLI